MIRKVAAVWILFLVPGVYSSPMQCDPGTDVFDVEYTEVLNSGCGDYLEGVDELLGSCCRRLLLSTCSDEMALHMFAEMPSANLMEDCKRYALNSVSRGS